MSDRGQTIVCEQEGADWLPFQHLRRARNSIGNKATEVVWADPAPADARPDLDVDVGVMPTVAPAPA